jgi:hypothetical protein
VKIALFACTTKTKANQAGEKVADKNIYANPFDPLTCPHLALAIWLWYDGSNLEFSKKPSLRGMRLKTMLLPINTAPKSLN